MFKGVIEKVVGLYVAVRSLSSQSMTNMVQLVWSHREGSSSEPGVHSLSKELLGDFSLSESGRSIRNGLECMKHVKHTKLHAPYLIFLKHCFFVLPR